MNSMIVRTEQPGDTEAIRQVHESAFPSAAEGELVDALRNAGRLSISLVAEAAEAVVGHIAFSSVTVAGTHDGLGLGPMAVLPAHQRRGIGGRLIVDGLAACRSLNAGFVVVLGWPAYYARFGFRPASEWGLFDEYGGGEAFQAIELRTNAIPRGAGLVKYAPEFAHE